MQLPGRSKPVLLGVMDTFSYPLASGAGCVDVGTTRLETMLADVAVAVHPDDARLSGLIGVCAVPRSLPPALSTSPRPSPPPPTH
jgi:valyl-tRNA synthetase